MLRLPELEQRSEAKGSPPPPGFRFEGPGDWRPLNDPQRQAESRAAYLAELEARKVH